ncbi:MAG TPA: M20/M25/M40 family metallo-hydrolase [Sediminibacterium sp.]|nr:M20/M25/M40 family metallo-hydrolase [Sediminibacterium sp.]
MKKITGLFILFACVAVSHAQQFETIVTTAEVARVEKTLCADDMRGRAAFTPDIDRAADFIAAEFTKIGLQTWNNSSSYLQSFTMVQPRFLGISGTINGQELDQKNVIAFTCERELKVTDQSGYEMVHIDKGANLNQEMRKYIVPSKNYVIWVDTSFARNFGFLTRMKRAMFKTPYSSVFILSADEPKSYNITAEHEIKENRLSNVVGVLPGKSLKNEYVIFSGHYDHLGVRSTGRNGEVLADSIYNGANDDAAGTTAMIMLAKYFKALGNNERTLVFAAFTAEEVGGYGATYFSRQFDPETVKAMFNIEMIGTESKWGKNSAYITGYEKTDMGKILQSSLDGTGFQFYPDPYTEQNLFYRSDNATLARLGVPAHTISTSKMDAEPNYHKPSDEFSTVDIDNMTQIIKAIALSSRSIVSGAKTPTRVDTSSLR